MSKKGSEKEFIFTLYQKENIHILEKTINLNLKEIVLEKKFDILDGGNMKGNEFLKLDMYGVESKLNVDVYVENVLLKSDNSHLERLLRLIQQIDKGIIIYQAMEFMDKDIQRLKEEVVHLRKDINLYFVKINPEFNQYLEYLNSKIHKLKVYENLDMLNKISEPIQLLHDNSIIQPIHGDFRLGRKDNLDFSMRQNVNDYLLKQLQLHVPYFFPFQKRKSNIDKNCIMQFGAGKSGVSLAISPESRGKALVELRFKEKSPVIYYAIKEKEEKAKERIGEKLKFMDNDHIIAFHFNPYSNVEETIESLVEIAERFIQAFSNYTYYYDRPEMWEQYKFGI